MEIASVVSGPIRTEERDQALTALIESHRTRLLSIIHKRICDQVEAEDILQDVFTEFVEAYDLGQAIEARPVNDGTELCCMPVLTCSPPSLRTRVGDQVGRRLLKCFP